MNEYSDFIKRKEKTIEPMGFNVSKEEMNNSLFDFQKEIVQWALSKGRACLFEDCGLGKTIQQLEWAFHIWQKTKQPVLILAPLAVAEQTKNEGLKFGYEVHVCKEQLDIKEGINITNYEKLHKFNVSIFSGVVLDESSILKSFSGKIRNQIIDLFAKTKYKLACSATPSPNDYMELGNHSEFLEVLSSSEMLSMFFVNDMSDIGQWRLKKHAGETKFWEWVSSWAIMLNNPADIGFSHDGFQLPPIYYHEIIIPAKPTHGLFVMEANTMEERRKVRKETIQLRCEKAADIINQTKEQWLIWCNLNDESALLTSLIDNAEEVSGSTQEEKRKDILLGFADKKVHRLVTKPKIAGFGMNWQNCGNMVFVGLSDSWEQLYQATRRVWRFGRKDPVNVYIIIEEREGQVLKNIKRKEKQAQSMQKNMLQHMQVYQRKTKINKQKLIKMEVPLWIN